MVLSLAEKHLTAGYYATDDGYNAIGTQNKIADHVANYVFSNDL